MAGAIVTLQDMKILLCTGEFLPVDGTAEILVGYALSLADAGFAPRILLLNQPDKANGYAKRLFDAGLRVSVLVRHPAYTYFRVRRRWAKLLHGAAWNEEESW